MYAFLYRLGQWLLTKLLVGGLILAAGLLAYAGWMYVQDDLRNADERTARIEQLGLERERLEALRAEAARAVVELREQAAVQQDRVQRAERVLATLRELENWWARWFGNPEQQAANAEQAQRMATLREGAATRMQELLGLAQGEEQRLPGLQAQLASTNDELARLQEAESKSLRYVRAAWEQSKWYLLFALLMFFFGPTVLKVLGYYVWAPLLSRGRPIQFEPDAIALPAVGGSRVSVQASLWPGEVLRVKEKFLQASDESLSRRTRFVLDWRIPFTSVACGLIELVEMRNGRAVGEQQVTFSTMDNPHTELAVIAIPDGGSLILRPSFLAGVITTADKPLQIRRRWALFRWQAWVTLQFRFFEFVGPCRLVVAGSRGVRGERLVEGEGMTRPARRTNQEATIGFTPNLEYLPVRAETFWGYYRDMNPLFDDLFAGSGLFVLQETPAGGPGGRAGRFWASWWNGVLKVFGL